LGQAKKASALRLGDLTETSRIRIGDLEIDFTSEFDHTWDDKGTGAKMDGSTWRPRPRDGFYPLGDLMVRSYDNPNGRLVALVAYDDGRTDNPALKPPTGFSYVWSNRIFMMNAPEGYVALGGIGCYGDLPDPALYRCVRKDLVVQALVGGEIYNDRGSGKRDDLSAWAITPPRADAGSAGLAPSTFIPVGSRSQPGPGGFWSFMFAIAEAPPTAGPRPPQLTSTNPPPDHGETVSYVVNLPWFAVNDPGLSAAEQIVKSPVYAMVRSDTYELAGFKYNTSSIVQQVAITIRLGISEEQVTSFAHTVGVELGMEWGIVKDVFSVSAKLSYAFTYTSSSSQGMERSHEITDTLSAAPHTAVALYFIKSTYDIYRQDGTRIQSVQPEFDVPKNFYNAQYPPALNSAELAA
jgi:hypothetical protein